MISMIWYGEDSQCQRQQGICKAMNGQVLTQILAQQGINLHQAVWVWPWQSRTKPMSNVESADLLQQWGRLLQSGITIEDSVRLVRPIKPSVHLRWQLCRLGMVLQQGLQLSQALAQLKLLPKHQLALLHAGEQTGSLSLVMAKLADQQTRLIELSKSLRKSLLMPSITLIAGLSISIMVLILLVPKIGELVASGDRPVPEATRLLLELSEFIHWQGEAVLLWSISIIAAVLMVLRSSWGQQLKSFCYYCLPMVARIIKQQEMVHLFQALAITQRGGVPIMRALNIFSQACQSTFLAKQIKHLQRQLTSGAALSQAFSKAGFSEAIVIALSIGENSGDLAATYENITKTMEVRLQETFDKVKQMLEPLVTIILATLVGGLVLAIYLPLIQLGSLV